MIDPHLVYLSNAPPCIKTSRPLKASHALPPSQHSLLIPPRNKPVDKREMPSSPTQASDLDGQPIQLPLEQLVARVFGVARGELKTATRGRAKVALARQVAMYLAHVVYGLNLTQVGQAFKRDRTTVAHACAIVEDHRDDRIFDCVMDNLEAIIKAWSTRPIATGVTCNVSHAWDRGTANGRYCK